MSKTPPTVEEDTTNPAERIDAAPRPEEERDPYQRWYTFDLPSGNLFFCERSTEDHRIAQYAVFPMNDTAWDRYAELCDRMRIPEQSRRRRQADETPSPGPLTLQPAPVGLPTITVPANARSIQACIGCEPWLVFHTESGLFAHRQPDTERQGQEVKEKLFLFEPADETGWTWYNSLCERLNVPQELRRAAA